MDPSRVRQGELIAGIGGLALFIFLFFDWFGGPGDTGLSGWDSLSGDVTGFIVAAAAMSGVVLGVLAAGGQRVNVPVPRGGITAALGWLAVGIILWRIFANGEADLEIGLFLGLIAAAAIAVGATIVLRADGYQPLVSFAPSAGTSRTVSSEAPTTEAPATKTAARKSPAKKPAARKKSAAKKRGARKRSASSR